MSFTQFFNNLSFYSNFKYFYLNKKRIKIRNLFHFYFNNKKTNKKKQAKNQYFDNIKLRLPSLFWNYL
jgi:hypothetical protein